MTKEKMVCFTNDIIKQGNSYCVRIPKTALTYMGFARGDSIKVRLSKPKEEKIPTGILDIYRKNMSDLKKYTDKELNSCIFTFTIEGSATKDLAEQEKKRVSAAFEKTLSMEKGKGFLDNYRLFKQNMTKKNMLKIVAGLRQSKYKELSDAIDIQMKEHKSNTEH